MSPGTSIHAWLWATCRSWTITDGGPVDRLPEGDRTKYLQENGIQMPLLYTARPPYRFAPACTLCPSVGGGGGAAISAVRYAVVNPVRPCARQSFTTISNTSSANPVLCRHPSTFRALDAS